MPSADDPRERLVRDLRKFERTQAIDARSVAEIVGLPLPLVESVIAHLRNGTPRTMISRRTSCPWWLAQVIHEGAPALTGYGAFTEADIAEHVLDGMPLHRLQRISGWPAKRIRDIAIAVRSRMPIDRTKIPDDRPPRV